jgi:hypothetical protein
VVDVWCQEGVLVVIESFAVVCAYEQKRMFVRIKSQAISFPEAGGTV